MKSFSCSVCDQVLFFDNSRCLRCNSELGYAPSSGRLEVVEVGADGSCTIAGEDSQATYRRCANQRLAACNWLVPFDDPDDLCASCRLTTIRPNDSESDALADFAYAETAKRRLMHQLNSLGLFVVGRDEDPEHGVAFEFRSSSAEAVMTGHDGGVITLDLSESDDAHREQVRLDLGEPYRTVLGHLRHEIGHYFWSSLVAEVGHLDEFRSLFGDETVSYQEALDQHYGGGDGPTDATDGTADAEWVGSYVSEYATMHPWEDWAETFAHYLHIRAGLETANSFGFVLGEPASTASQGTLADRSGSSVGPMVEAWLGTTLVMNAMARSLGTGNHYPFVLSPFVIDKLDFVHRVVTSAALPERQEPKIDITTVDDLRH